MPHENLLLPKQSKPKRARRKKRNSNRNGSATSHGCVASRDDCLSDKALASTLRNHGWLRYFDNARSFLAPYHRTKMLTERENNIWRREEERRESSFNHSYICAEILEQLVANKAIKALPELTLAIERGLTPDISIYPREKVTPNFLKD
jgi:hypothetical protein